MDLIGQEELAPVGHPVELVRLQPELRWEASLAWSALRRPGPAVAALIEFARSHPELAALGSWSPATR